VNERSVFAPDSHDQGVAQWVYDHGQVAGQSTDTLSGASALYLPLIASRSAVGVLGIRPAQPRRFLEPDQLHLLETFASLTAQALERVGLAMEAQRAHVQAEAERMRSSLLSSVSHDLRTPLATITGALSSLQDDSTLAPAVRDELIETAYGEAERLNRLVGNLLDMTRIESGGVQAQKEWQPLEEVVGAAVTRLEDQLRDHPLTISLPPDLPLVSLDSVLIEQLLINVLENASKYTPPGSPIEITATATDAQVIVEVADRGPGIPPGDEQRVFEKFYRADTSSGHRGAGLGLAICRGIAAAHGGRIWTENRPGGGAAFRFVLPLDGTPPIAAETDNPTREPTSAEASATKLRYEEDFTAQ
jgi:two-component system, OmpR family, sensor histidine kinase KdpD